MDPVWIMPGDSPGVGEPYYECPGTLRGLDPPFEQACALAREGVKIASRHVESRVLRYTPGKPDSVLAVVLPPVLVCGECGREMRRVVP